MEVYFRLISFKSIKFVGMMKVSLIGAGNLATQLGKSLRSAGVPVCQVFSRTEEAASTLAEILDADWLTDITLLRNDADIYVISVKDSVLCSLIPKVCKGREDKLFLHTAGSMPMRCFEGQARHYGVFYPMQTFSKRHDVCFADIPVFIEGNTQETEEQIRTCPSAVPSDFLLVLFGQAVSASCSCMGLQFHELLLQRGFWHTRRARCPF